MNDIPVEGTIKPPSYLEIHLEIDTEGIQNIMAKETSSFQIMKFSFLCSNILTAPAYIYVSQLIRHPSAYMSYHDVLDRWLRLTMRLLNQYFKIEIIPA